MHFSSHNKTNLYVCKVAGPVILSAFSLFVLFWLLQPLALLLDPSFSLLANKGIGKIGITIMVLIHILLISTTAGHPFFAAWKEKNFLFITKTKWLLPFSVTFIPFALVHILILLGFCMSNNLVLDLSKFSLVPTQGISLLIGFIATFFLAWTEEAIFRGTLYLYVAQYINRFWSILFSSLIFCLAHNLTNPIALLTTDWQLGLGLFLLGALLNLIFALTGKLYMSMGAHAGLVFVKVFLRRVPVIVPAIGVATPWWFSPDLRMAFPIHVLFVVVIAWLVIRHRKILFSL